MVNWPCETALYKVLNPEKQVDLLGLAAEKRSKKEPLIVVFLGVNGTGKTTTIAKVAHLLLSRTVFPLFLLQQIPIGLAQ